MMQTRAIVIRLEGQDALVEATQGGGCGSCSNEKGCGSGKLSQLFSGDVRRFRVRNVGNAQVGTLVQVSMPDGVLLNSAILMYILPLLLLLLCALLAGQMAPAASSVDAYSAAGALAGLILGFVLVKLISVQRKLFSVAQPVILSVEEQCSA
jgi:sigma-E factor negative regulatory protein RseC